jgi:hypothetical protein
VPSVNASLSSQGRRGEGGGSAVCSCVQRPGAFRFGLPSLRHMGSKSGRDRTIRTDGSSLKVRHVPKKRSPRADKKRGTYIHEVFEFRGGVARAHRTRKEDIPNREHGG